MKEQKFESYFGRKIAIDASMSIYQFLVPSFSLFLSFFFFFPCTCDEPYLVLVLWILILIECFEALDLDVGFCVLNEYRLWLEELGPKC